MTHNKEYTIITHSLGSLGSCRILSINRRLPGILVKGSLHGKGVEANAIINLKLGPTPKPQILNPETLLRMRGLAPLSRPVRAFRLPLVKGGLNVDEASQFV